MNTHDPLAETQGILEGVVSRWAPSTGEQFDIRMMRALLHLNAYEQDVARVNQGEPPIQTSYPIPLPSAKQGAAPELLEALEAIAPLIGSVLGRLRYSIPSDADILPAIAAAIAKAKGEA